MKRKRIIILEIYQQVNDFGCLQYHGEALIGCTHSGRDAMAINPPFIFAVIGVKLKSYNNH